MKLKLFSLLLFYASASFTQTFSVNKVGVKFPNEILISKHAFYEIGFNTKYHLPAWTYYSLTKDQLDLAVLERKGAFVKDPYVKDLQAGNDDYSASGYDKGHMVPCEDMSFSEQAMKETFYYSNCAPQTTELNRGEWKMLEELTREWAKDHNEVMVFSGPVLEAGLMTLGENKIPVPKHFYKIVVTHKEQRYNAIAFVMPNSTMPLNAPVNYVCSIDSVETITGLDFFTDLPDHIEAQFENKFQISDWDWKKHKHNTAATPNDSIKHEQNLPKQEIVSVQCKGKTKKGKRCKKKTTSPNGFCNLHGGD